MSETKLSTNQFEFKTHRELGPVRAAHLLFSTLAGVYGRHNLMGTAGDTLVAIREGKIEPFFSFDCEDGALASCCALIHNQRTVEIGRAANANGRNGGGKLMLQAVERWRRFSDERPLIAEIRMAALFKGIPGGQGSQGTLLPPEKAGMIPHAFLPAFHHPGPVGVMRQELFCFATSEKTPSPRIAPEEISLPDDRRINRELLERLLGINGFSTTLRVDSSSPVEDFPADRGEENPFDLVFVDSFHPRLAAVAKGLINKGFQAAGISAPHQGRLQILFGRLGRCLFAPTEPMRNFPHIPVDFIMQIDEQFRSV